MAETPEEKHVEGYLETIDRIEPDITVIDKIAAQASMAISLKRIADSLEILIAQQVHDEFKEKYSGKNPEGR